MIVVSTFWKKVELQLPNTTTNLAATIEIKYGDLGAMLSWCKVNCNSEWDCYIYREAGSEPGLYKFIFEDERDYSTFLLWKS
jgi:hypothetical protein